MPVWLLRLVGGIEIVVLVAVAALVLATPSRSASVARLLTTLALLLWACFPVVLAGVWFLVAVAAHRVDESLTRGWIVANASYPLVGVAIVLTHRRLLRRFDRKISA